MSVEQNILITIKIFAAIKGDGGGVRSNYEQQLVVLYLSEV